MRCERLGDRRVSKRAPAMTGWAKWQRAPCARRARRASLCRHSAVVPLARRRRRGIRSPTAPPPSCERARVAWRQPHGGFSCRVCGRRESAFQVSVFLPPLFFGESFFTTPPTTVQRPRGPTRDDTRPTDPESPTLRLRTHSLPVHTWVSGRAFARSLPSRPRARVTRRRQRKGMSHLRRDGERQRARDPLRRENVVQWFVCRPTSDIRALQLLSTAVLIR